MAKRRVAVTGLGIVAPSGIGKEAFWTSSVAHRCFIRRVTRFDSHAYPCQMGGEVEGFKAEEYLAPKIIKQTDRSTHMAIAACRLAGKDGELDLQKERLEIGMYFASLFGGMQFAEPELYAQLFLGPDRVSAYQAIAWFYAATQGQLSIGTGIQGFGKSLVADRAGGLQAVALGALAIQMDHCNIAFVGGFEAPLVPYAFLIHHTSDLLSTKNHDGAYCPFDVQRTGLVLGEGSGILLLEDLEHARHRGAPVYAEVAGWAVSCDAYHFSQPAPNPDHLARCIEQALTNARLCPGDIDHISADGLGTELADRTEAAAINAVFKHDAESPTVSAPKSAIGHTLAAAGAIDAIWGCLMIQNNMVLPTVNLEQPDVSLHLNHVVGGPRSQQVNAVLCVNRGWGGLNTCLVLRRYVQ